LTLSPDDLEPIAHVTKGGADEIAAPALSPAFSVVELGVADLAASRAIHCETYARATDWFAAKWRSHFADVVPREADFKAPPMVAR
jgi:hypothetical protein